MEFCIRARLILWFSGVVALIILPLGLGFCRHIVEPAKSS
jgi:hypothetical protein